MKVFIVKVENNMTATYGFNSITDAYYYYLNNFSTRREWIYYKRCAGCLLNQVEDERVMEAIFRNVFDKNVCLLT